MLHVRLLSRFAVEVDGVAVPESAWQLRKAKSLVKLLALATDHRLYRDQVLDALWPDSPTHAASHTLHQTLYIARRALSLPQPNGPSYLHSARDLLQLGPDSQVSTDLESLEAAVARAKVSNSPEHYRQALALCTGELLPEDRYQEWAAPARAQARQLHQSLLTDFASVLITRQEYSEAADVLEALLAQDPLIEEAHRTLMTCYARSGQRPRALRHYAELKQLLARELGVDPEEATEALHTEILTGTPMEASPMQPTPRLSPLVTAGGPSHRSNGNLPGRLTSLVGRASDSEVVARLISQHRLVTLTGPGGVGKSSLVVDAAAHLQPSLTDGAWLVDAAGGAAEQTLVRKLAATFGLPGGAERRVAAAVTTHLRGRQALLLLDNCEPAIEACAALAQHLLEACPHLQILATSREPLRIPGEITYRVAELPVPDPNEEDARFTTTVACPSVHLFLDRTAAVRPELSVSAGALEHVAAICRSLEGNPLAIELAAARVHATELQEVAAMVAGSLLQLHGGSRTAPPRHQSVLASVAWSYRLLTAEEQTVFLRLAQLSDGFSRAAAAVACTAAGIDITAVADLLASLVDKSMLTESRHQEGPVRYSFGRAYREYALRELQAQPTTLPAPAPLLYPPPFRLASPAQFPTTVPD